MFKATSWDMWSPHHCFSTDLFCTDLPSLGDRCIFYTLDLSQYFSFSLSHLPFSLSQFLSRKYSKLHIIRPQTRQSGHLNIKYILYFKYKIYFTFIFSLDSRNKVVPRSFLNPFFISWAGVSSLFLRQESDTSFRISKQARLTLLPVLSFLALCQGWD